MNPQGIARSLKHIVSDKETIGQLKSAYHMHCSRQGPAVSNEIVTAIHEHRFNPSLHEIIGVQQPGGSVAQYLFYWLNGLPDELIETIIQLLRRNDTDLVKSLCRPAFSYHINQEEFIRSCIVPVIEHYQEKIIAICPIEIIMECVRSSTSGDTIGTLLTQSSIAITNCLLEVKKLPRVRFDRVDPSIVSQAGLTPKYICYPQLLRMSQQSHISKSRQYSHATDFLRKKMRSYRSVPTPTQSEHILKSFSQNTSHSGIRANSFTIANVYNGGGLTFAPLAVIEDIKDSARLCFIDNISEEEYIDGSMMVDIMFMLASQKHATHYLILQEFMREFDYSRYTLNSIRYPSVILQKARLKTWDAKNFPEFDQNIFTAIGYLLDV